VSYETRAYDDEHGIPVAVIVATGTHDVSRLINLFGGATANVEQLQTGRKLLAQIRNHNGGRAALQLLARHGGPDFTPETTTVAIPRDKLLARIAELEAELDKVRPVLQTIATSVGADLCRYANALDDQWPGWREFAENGGSR